MVPLRAISATLGERRFCRHVQGSVDMKHGVIPGTLIEKPVDNGFKENTPWPKCRKRAGLSAFGFGGTNAHAVFEEYKAQGPEAPSTPTRNNGNVSSLAGITVSIPGTSRKKSTTNL